MSSRSFRKMTVRFTCCIINDDVSAGSCAGQGETYAKTSISSQTFVRMQHAKLRMVEGLFVKHHLKIFHPLVTALENLGEENLKFDVVRERLFAEDLKKIDRESDSYHEKAAAETW